MSFSNKRRSGEPISPSQRGKYSEIGKLLQESPTMQLAPSQPRYILWNEYEVGDMIGSGSFGHVYQCKHVKTGKEYAVKKFKNKYQTKKKALEQREMQVLQRFDMINRKTSG